MLCKNWYLLGEKKLQATSTKQDLGTCTLYLLGVRFRNVISNKQSHHFHKMQAYIEITKGYFKYLSLREKKTDYSLCMANDLN